MLKEKVIWTDVCKIQEDLITFQNVPHDSAKYPEEQIKKKSSYIHINFILFLNFQKFSLHALKKILHLGDTEYVNRCG